MTERRERRKRIRVGKGGGRGARVKGACCPGWYLRWLLSPMAAASTSSVADGKVKKTARWDCRTVVLLGCGVYDSYPSLSKFNSRCHFHGCYTRHRS